MEWGGVVERRTCRRRGTLRGCPRRRRSFGARRGAFRGGGGHLLVGADAGRWWSRWDGTFLLDRRCNRWRELTAVHLIVWRINSSRIEHETISRKWKSSTRSNGCRPMTECCARKLLVQGQNAIGCLRPSTSMSVHIKVPFSHIPPLIPPSISKQQPSWSPCTPSPGGKSAPTSCVPPSRTLELQPQAKDC